MTLNTQHVTSCIIYQIKTSATCSLYFLFWIHVLSLYFFCRSKNCGLVRNRDLKINITQYSGRRSNSHEFVLNCDAISMCKTKKYMTCVCNSMIFKNLLTSQLKNKIVKYRRERMLYFRLHCFLQLNVDASKMMI